MPNKKVKALIDKVKAKEEQQEVVKDDIKAEADKKDDKEISVNPLNDDALFRNELLIRLDFLNHSMKILADAVTEEDDS